MKRSIPLVFAALLIVGLVAMPALAASNFALPAFEQQWREGEAVVPNFWGPLANATNGLYEPYVESSGGLRLVQYFDKGRMELTDGTLTNGLLATELTTGQVQLGDATFRFQSPPAIPVAGDPDNPGPTYAGLFSNAAPLFEGRDPQIGAAVTTAVQPDGTIGGSVALGSSQATIATYDTPTRHNVATPFITFRDRAGLLTIGYARSEPFLTTVRVAGQSRAVMVQVFQRRILTFTPDNPTAFQVEFGNIGQHYYRWRYETPAPTPTPTPGLTPGPAPRFTSGPQRTALSDTTAVFEWRTDQETTSRLEFDTDRNRTNYRNAVGSTTNFRTRHRVEITGLRQETTYFVRYRSENRQGQLVTPEIISSFRTLATTPPPGPGTPTPPPSVGNTITAPASNARVSSPLVVRGTEDGTAFEANVVVRLRNRTTGEVLASEPTTVQRPEIGQPGPFEARLTFLQPTADTPGVVELLTPAIAEGEQPQLRASVNVVIAARSPSAAERALNVSWQWTELVPNQGSPTTVPNPQNYTIVLRPDGTVSVRADCNQINGTYVGDAYGNLTIQLGPSTLVACEPGSLGQEFTTALSGVRTYALSGDRATLFSGSNRLLFRNGGRA